MLWKRLKGVPAIKRLVLIGFSGSGKTTVGKLLAQTTSLPLYSIDQMVEDKAGISIPEIFERYGEEYFRQLESGIIKEVVEKGEGIIDCGGGVVERESNMQLLKSFGEIVWLKCPLETLLSRLEKNDRPLLKNKDILYIQEFFGRREVLYQRYGDITVNSDRDLPRIIAELLEILNLD
ncbi:shikimate kinase [Anaerobranca gottschalkii]|uniref:Shikimate kinase n=1 Tax=Anaerobranca gottschalkii DSM 13577 TaxID=1120990 RepID=A0A1H9Y4A9_9FIRM|nr:shikimate kinase [Anaerobranca gottschalkii]SES63530.1 shikimate kinase [Anaerobranca gottschalkii DSM 13577]